MRPEPILIRPPPPHFFVDRLDELGRLHEHWERGDKRLVVLLGLGGIGKTALLLTFANRVESSGGRVAFVADGAPPPTVPDVIDDLLPRGSRRGLLCWDIPPDETVTEQVLSEARRRVPEEMVVATTRHREAVERLAHTGSPGAPSPLVLEVPGLSHEALVALFELLLPELPAEDWARLAAASEGSPLAAQLLAHAAKRESVDSVLQHLAEQRFASVWYSDADHQYGLSRLAADVPLASVPHGREVEVRVEAVWDDLIRRLAKRPDLMQALGPRKFEELMAELYTRQGFEVELTPQTRDGGVDLYVVRYEPFGRMVTLVDAKRVRQDRKVGVGVVRQLYGVVEAQRAAAGVIATTSFFTPDAQRFSKDLGFRMFLQDYLDLQKMIRDIAGPT